jgi:hypothetical protein
MKLCEICNLPNMFPYERIVFEDHVLCLEYVSSSVRFMQEDSVKVGKVTAAGMYFLGFPVYRFEQNNLVSLQDQLVLLFFRAKLVLLLSK